MNPGQSSDFPTYNKVYIYIHHDILSPFPPFAGPPHGHLCDHCNSSSKKTAKSDPKMEYHPVLFRGTYRNPLFWSFVWLGDSNWQNTICRHWLHFWGASCHNQLFFMAFPIFLMPFQSKFYAHHFLASFSDGPWWPIIDPHRWVDFQKLCSKAWISESKNSNWQSLLLKSPSKTAESQIQKLVWVVLVESCFILDYHYPRIFALWMAHSVHPVPMNLSFLCYRVTSHLVREALWANSEPA